MLGTRVVLKRKGKDEAEKPFWISFADMMTALMVLFLVVMGVALLAITHKEVIQVTAAEEHSRNIDFCFARLTERALDYEGIRVDEARQAIDFGDIARFAFAKSTLLPQQEAAIRRFMPEVLSLAHDDVCSTVFKRVIVEGYTDSKGSYLSNLNLSLQRSQRVLCAIFANRGDALLDDIQKEQVRSLFLVGGYSFNNTRILDEESRRVEMRIEILGVGEKRAEPMPSDNNFGECAL